MPIQIQKLCIALLGTGCTIAASAAEPSVPRFTVETVAGNGKEGDLPNESVPALEAPVPLPFGVEVGPDGALYITNIGQHRVLRLDTKSGRLTSVAGNGTKGYSGDGGSAAAAQLN